MPELPEVETIRRSLAPRLVGRRVTRVLVKRSDVIRSGTTDRLGSGRTFHELIRHGKQLALVLDDGAVLHVHLGMSGQLFVLAPGRRPPRSDHVHVRWSLDDGSAMLFRDPRRFGGVWVFDSLAQLRAERWLLLGPDALTIRASALRAALRDSRRAVKACLLDQRVLAGVGNIYADESLFISRIDPRTPASSLDAPRVTLLASSIRRVLRDAIAARGSSLRDFVDAEFRAGEQQLRFRVYGRAGQSCPVCSRTLESIVLAGRTTTYCPRCQGIPRMVRPLLSTSDPLTGEEE